jgi:hypothetical protein
MNRFLGALALTAFALTACGGSAVTGSNVPTSPVLNPGAAAPDQALSPDRKKHRKYVRTHFFIKIPKKKRGKHPIRGGHFIGAGARSVNITLNSVQGGATPPSGLLLSVTTNISGCTSGCTVDGPLAPPGVDNMTVTVYDGVNASADAISTATQNFTIAAGTANNLSITLRGIVGVFSAAAAGDTVMPSGTAGTPIASAPLDIEAKDDGGDVITGTYASPFTIQVSGDGGATSIAVNGGTPGSSVQTTASTDTFTFNYSGLAIDTATLSSPDAQDSAQFQPSVSNPTSVCNGGGVSDQTECAAGPEIDLYAASGTGSSASFTTSQTGWSESPFLQTFTESDTCSSIATISTTDNLTFTATAVASPSVGSCTVTVTGGGASANNSEGVTVTYTTSGFGVNSRHANPKHHAKP